MFRIEFVPSAAKDFHALEGIISSRIVKAFERLVEDPVLGKPLQGPYHGLRSYRVGDYRLVYKVETEIRMILIYRIGHRRDVYRV